MARPDDTTDEEEILEAGADQAEDSDEEAATSEADMSSDGSQASGAAGNGKKKKKKKPKKRKSPAAGAEGAAATTSTAPKVDKAEADRKFAAALSAIKCEDPWVELSSSNLQDAKVKKLLEQLKKNDSLTSLNLSQNSLTDDGAQAIAAAFGAGTTAPGLITLDLRENNFTDQGLTILDGLKKVRRNLSVMTGAIMIPAEVAPSSGKAGADSALRDLSDSRLVRKYFQIGNEDDDDTSTGMPLAPEPSIDPADLWQQLDTAVSRGTSDIPTQQGLLKQLCQQMASELSSIADGNYANCVNKCPHVKACLEHLHTLGTVLDMTPVPVAVQYSRQPQAAVGSHRVFATEAIATLVASQNVGIDEQIASAKLVPRVMHLAISHPVCSALHARALKLLRAGLCSKVEDLLCPILAVSGWGMELQQPAYSSRPPTADGELCQPLPSFLANQGSAALGVVSGVRHTLMGFVIEASKAINAAVQPAWDPDSDDDTPEEKDTPCLELLKRVLAANSSWSEYVQEGLGQLATEQEGDLGGPRAVRALNNLEGPELAELAGGGLITGQEILALLQGMSGMSTT